MAISENLGNRILDAILSNKPFEPILNVHLSLHLADAGITGANEITPDFWPSYRRIDLSVGNSINRGFARAVDKTAYNLGDLLYPIFDGTTPLVLNNFGLWDAEKNGNFMWGGALVAPIMLQPQDQCVVFAEQIILKME